MSALLPFPRRIIMRYKPSALSAGIGSAKFNERDELGEAAVDVTNGIGPCHSGISDEPQLR